MAELKFHKVATLPGSLDANAFYYVENGSYAETYVTNSQGVARMVGNSTMINQLIAAQLSAVNTLKVVADITARNALNPTVVTLAYVLNATGDNTVASGGASYLFNPSGSSWTKLTEFESMDVVLSWSNITGKPGSTPAAIDQAVTNSHTHANKTLLDNLTAPGDVLTYKGAEVHGWKTTNW